MTYRDSHIGVVRAQEYHSGFADEATSKHLLWSLEQRLLARILDEHRPRSALDFACGSGRILSELERRVPHTVGIDVSADMLGIASQSCTRSRLVHGDLTRDPEVVSETFDIVTAFRFFLNAEHDLRRDALSALARVLDPSGRAVINFHLNPWSVAGLHGRLYAVRNRRRLRPMLSVRQARRLMKASGFSVRAVYPYGYLLPHTERLLWPRPQRWLEHKLMQVSHAPALAQCFIIVAKLR